MNPDVPIIATPQTPTGWVGYLLPTTDGRPELLGRALTMLGQAHGMPPASAWRDLARPQPVGPNDATHARWLYLVYRDGIETHHSPDPGRWLRVQYTPFARKGAEQ